MRYTLQNQTSVRYFTHFSAQCRSRPLRFTALNVSLDPIRLSRIQTACCFCLSFLYTTATYSQHVSAGFRLSVALVGVQAIRRLGEKKGTVAHL